MRRALSIILIVAFTGFVLHTSVYAGYSQNYEYYLQKANEALSLQDYDLAIENLRNAHRCAPSYRYPLEKIKAIQDLKKYDSIPLRPDALKKLRLYRTYSQLGRKALNEGDYSMASYYFRLASVCVPGTVKNPDRINLTNRMSQGRTVQIDQLPAKSSIENAVVSAPVSQKRWLSMKSAIMVASEDKSRTLLLDDRLWATQPKTQVQIHQGASVILEGKDIDRFLVISPGVINIERVDRGHLSITGVNIGTTFIHVWDDRGRWTFYVQIVFPVNDTPVQDEAVTNELRAQPFQFSYALDGGALYRGQQMSSVKRQNLNMQQTLGLKGETPYGVADGSISYYKFAQSTEATNYTVGLSGLKGAGFSGVNLRGYDAVKYFSPLTFPGQYFRGFLIEGETLGEKIAASYVHGQDRFTYSYLSPGVIEDRRSYVEGTRVTLFPNEENQYSFNYARGYGPARQNFLKSQVYSIEARHRIDPVLLQGEVATNTDTLAETLMAKLGNDRRSLRVNFRDIDKDFTTITGLPSNQGEIGANVGLDLDFEAFDVNSNLDFYRDRFLPNTDNPDALNYDFNSSFQIPLAQRTDLISTVYYLDTPGELSPRRNFRWVNTLSQRFKIWADRELRFFVGASYNRNRIKQTPISEYDRYGVNTGLQLGLIKHLSYFVNYEYSWVNELLSGDYGYPSVLNTGLNFAHEITSKASANASFYYRDEQNAMGANSFLAGEDSITGGLGLSYRPVATSELFVDSRVRNVWKENPDNPAYNEIDVRWGVRSQWDLPFSWSPSGTIRGIVFKDLNGNGTMDLLEPGIPGAHVKIGNKDAVTDQQGRFRKRVRAKSLIIAVDTSSVADGYVLTTPVDLEVSIPYDKNINFGFSTQAGIYGIFFNDLNGNHEPDEGDEFIQKAKIVLDGKTVEVSDYDGTYFFKSVSSGRHTLRIDVNSLPLDYLPLVKLMQTVDVSEGTTYIFHVPVKKKAQGPYQSTTNEAR